MNRLFTPTLFILLVASVAVGQESTATVDEAAQLEAERLTKLTSLERLKEAVAADANTRFGLLSTISPRDASAEDRVEMVRLLAGQLDSDYPDIRARAARVLGLFEADAAPAIPALMKLIGDKETTVTLEAVWVPVSKTLAAIGAVHTLEPLMNALGETYSLKIEKDDTGYRVSWGDRVKYYGITAAISAMGEDAKSTAPVFVELLRSGPENRRWATMYTLSNFGDAALPAIPDYIHHLDHPEFNLQVIACRALAVLGEASEAAVPKLIQLTEKGTILSTRTHAAMCLGAIGPVEGVSINDLTDIFTSMIEEPNAISQERGLIALSRLGRRVENTKSFVQALLENEDFSQRPEAARTLWQITGDNVATLDILQGLLDDPTYDMRVLGVLEEMGPDAAPMAATLAEKLKTDDQSLRQMLVEILAGMGAAAKEHVDAIRGALEGAAPDTALAIDKALEKIEGSSTDVVKQPYGGF